MSMENDMGSQIHGFVVCESQAYKKLWSGPIQNTRGVYSRQHDEFLM